MDAAHDHDPLQAFGWSSEWAAKLARFEGARPARVVRHDGVALAVVGESGAQMVPLTKQVRPRPVVGDWVALRGDEVMGVLERSSLLQRLAVRSDAPQPLAANVDEAWLVCGLDRPVKAGRLAREASLVWDAGAVPLVVLTKAARHDAPEDVADAVRATTPGIEVVVTSALEGVGVDDLRRRLKGRTTTMIGESGAGKSTLLNTVLGVGTAATGAVRAGDAKGRHTTTTRELHCVFSEGVLIDMPGIRSVGLIADADAIAMTFPDVTELGELCRFGDCQHDREPDCAVRAAIAGGRLDARRLGAWRELNDEAAAAAAAAEATDARGRRFSARPGVGPRESRSAPSQRRRR